MSDSDERERARVQARFRMTHGVALDYRRFVLNDRLAPASPASKAHPPSPEEARPAQPEPDLTRLRAAVLDTEALRRDLELRKACEDLLSSPNVRRASARTQRHLFRLLRTITTPEPTKGAEASTAVHVGEVVSDLTTLLGKGRFADFNETVQGAVLASLERLFTNATFRRVLVRSLTLPAVSELGGPDAVALVRMLAGPDLGAGANPVRLKRIEAAWDRQRARFERMITKEKFTQGDLSAQVELVRHHLHDARELAILMDAINGRHTVVVIGANGTPPLLSYGRLPVRSEGARIWSRIRSPEVFAEMGWPTSGPFAEQIYEHTVYAGTLAEHALLIESIERSFPITDITTPPAAAADPSRLIDAPRFRAFVHELLPATAQKHANAGVLARGFSRAGQLIPPGDPALRRVAPERLE